jgi:hypothetical protein
MQDGARTLGPVRSCAHCGATRGGGGDLAAVRVLCYARTASFSSSVWQPLSDDFGPPDFCVVRIVRPTKGPVLMNTMAKTGEYGRWQRGTRTERAYLWAASSDEAYQSPCESR